MLVEDPRKAITLLIYALTSIVLQNPAVFCRWADLSVGQLWRFPQRVAKNAVLYVVRHGGDFRPAHPLPASHRKSLRKESNNRSAPAGERWCESRYSTSLLLNGRQLV